MTVNLSEAVQINFMKTRENKIREKKGVISRNFRGQ